MLSFCASIEYDSVLELHRILLESVHPEKLYKLRCPHFHHNIVCRPRCYFLLKTVFRKAEPEATAIMLAVHRAGVGVAGVYTRDVAETRAERGRQLAEREGFPLLLSVEADDA